MYFLKLASTKSCNESFECVNDIFYEKYDVSLVSILTNSH